MRSHNCAAEEWSPPEPLAACRVAIANARLKAADIRAREKLQQEHRSELVTAEFETGSLGLMLQGTRVEMVVGDAAQQAGITAGMQIIHLNGKPCSGLSDDQIQEALKLRPLRIAFAINTTSQNVADKSAESNDNHTLQTSSSAPVAAHSSSPSPDNISSPDDTSWPAPSPADETSLPETPQADETSPLDKSQLWKVDWSTMECAQRLDPQLLDEKLAAMKRCCLTHCLKFVIKSGITDYVCLKHHREPLQSVYFSSNQSAICPCI